MTTTTPPQIEAMDASLDLMGEARLSLVELLPQLPPSKGEPLRGFLEQYDRATSILETLLGDAVAATSPRDVPVFDSAVEKFSRLFTSTLGAAHDERRRLEMEQDWHLFDPEPLVKLMRGDASDQVAAFDAVVGAAQEQLDGLKPSGAFKTGVSVGAGVTVLVGVGLFLLPRLLGGR